MINVPDNVQRGGDSWVSWLFTPERRASELEQMASWYNWKTDLCVINCFKEELLCHLQRPPCSSQRLKTFEQGCQPEGTFSYHDCYNGPNVFPEFSSPAICLKLFKAGYDLNANRVNQSRVEHFVILEWNSPSSLFQINWPLISGYSNIWQNTRLNVNFWTRPLRSSHTLQPL